MRTCHECCHGTSRQERTRCSVQAPRRQRVHRSRRRHGQVDDARVPDPQHHHRAFAGVHHLDRGDHLHRPGRRRTATPRARADGEAPRGIERHPGRPAGAHHGPAGPRRRPHRHHPLVRAAHPAHPCPLRPPPAGLCPRHGCGRSRRRAITRAGRRRAPADIPRRRHPSDARRIWPVPLRPARRAPPARRGVAALGRRRVRQPGGRRRHAVLRRRQRF